MAQQIIISAVISSVISLVIVNHEVIADTIGCITDPIRSWIQGLLEK